jgi:hypothetical protein
LRYLRIEGASWRGAGGTEHQDSRLAQLAQKYQDGEGELQPSPVPEDITRESEVPSEADGEKHQSDDGSDAPGSQNVLARSLRLRGAAPRWVGIVHGSASCHARIAAKLMIEGSASSRRAG